MALQETVEPIRPILNGYQLMELGFHGPAIREATNKLVEWQESLLPTIPTVVEAISFIKSS
jgi:hypothetical protein